MEQNLKELLLKDLCARLPYNLYIRVIELNCAKDDAITEGYIGNLLIDNRCLDYDISEILNQLADDELIVIPYLRLMSSMTEKEKSEWYSTFDSVYDLVEGGDPNNEDDYNDSWHDEPSIKSFDYLNSHHFDYRGLIEKGLALEAPEGMYNN